MDILQTKLFDQTFVTSPLRAFPIAVLQILLAILTVIDKLIGRASILRYLQTV